MLQKGTPVKTLISKLSYPAGSTGIVEKLEKDHVWVAIYLPNDDIPDDIIRYRYSEITPQ